MEIMLDQDENGELQVKPTLSTEEAAAAAPTANESWLSRAFRACFRRPAAQPAQQDDLEMGVASRGASVSRSVTRSITRGGRRRSTLQEGVVDEEAPGTLQVQWSGPSVSELRREAEPSEAVLQAARSVGGDTHSVSTSHNSTHNAAAVQ